MCQHVHALAHCAFYYRLTVTGIKLPNKYHHFINHITSDFVPFLLFLDTKSDVMFVRFDISMPYVQLHVSTGAP